MNTHQIMRNFAASLILFSFSHFASAEGARVLANWPADGLWYPGKVVAVVDADVKVSFDDGDVLVVRKSQVRSLDWTRGSRLQCNWKNQGKYYPGIVQSMQGEEIELLYDDGYRELMTVSRCRSER